MFWFFFPWRSSLIWDYCQLSTSVFTLFHFVYLQFSLDFTKLLVKADVFSGKQDWTKPDNPLSSSQSLNLAQVPLSGVKHRTTWSSCQATRTSSYRCASVPQKFLRRFYGLPVGLQGSRKAAGNFQKKIKQMQEFFKLKVIRSASIRCSGGNWKQAVWVLTRALTQDQGMATEVFPPFGGALTSM